MAKSPKHNQTQSPSTTYILEMAKYMADLQQESFKAGVEYQKQKEKNDRTN